MTSDVLICPGCGHDAHTPGYCVMIGCGNCEVGQPRCAHCDATVALGKRLCGSCSDRDLCERIEWEWANRSQS